MNYSKKFKEAVDFSKEKELFLGYGNPSARILMIGKEQYYKSSKPSDTEEFYQDLLEKRNEVNQINISSWLRNIDEKFVPEWNSNLDANIINNNPQTVFWNQRNIQNKKLKNGEWNLGTSNTYLHYQKIYQNVFLGGVKETNINFQKEFFISELNDLLAEKDFNFKRLRELKQGFISKRENLFKLSFFRSFPVVIIASGHYGRDFDFDIQKTFGVEWTKETIPVGKSWINLHYSTDAENKKLLIHTRQLSTSVTNELIEKISKIIKDFLKELEK